MSREQRKGWSARLREQGYTLEDIGERLGVDAETVRRDAKSTLPNKKVTGKDGKKYPARKKRKKSATAQDSAEPYLRRIEELEAYKQLTNKDGDQFQSAIEFYEYPEPWGLGNVERLKERIKELKSPNANQYTKSADVNSHQLNRNEIGTGNKSYILARLKRDHPQILSDYQNGHYKSARQAGIAAGFIKDMKRIQVLPDPEKIAIKLKERLTEDQIAKLISLLLK